MKKIVTLCFFAVIFLTVSCSTSPCDCSEEFYYSAKYPLASDEDKISDCMELYYKEKGLPNNPNYPAEDYVAAHYYFGNHPCHSD